MIGSRKEMKIIEQTLTIKVHLKLHDAADSDKLWQVTIQYMRACNDASQYIFDHEFELKTTRLHKQLYHHLRDQYHLKSQLAISVVRTVIANYKTVKTQLKQKPYHYWQEQKQEKKKLLTVKRDLNWLWYALRYRRPQADLQRNRDWSITKNGDLSVNTLTGRIKVTPIYQGFEQYLDGTWKFGVAKLIKSGHKWYLHIAVTKDFPELDIANAQDIVGIDRGLRFLATTYDHKEQVTFFSGQDIIRKRRKFKNLRAKLQAKGTKSARHRLKKIGQRENRWMTTINHQLSKTLVQQFGPKTLLVLEDLTNVRSSTERSPKASRYERVSWAFFQLEQFLTYKAQMMGSAVVKVAPDYTSQRCPKCALIRKENRDHYTHEYQCSHCHYRSNDDRIGAMNIQWLGQQYQAGVKHPKLTVAG